MEPYTKTTNSGRTLFEKWETLEDGEKTILGNGVRSTPNSWVDTLNGFKNSNWKTQVRNHQNATTPLSGRKKTIRYKLGHITVTGEVDKPLGGNPRVRTSYADGVLCPHYGFSGSFYNSPKVENQASAGFYKKLRSVQTSFETGIFLGELQESIRMLMSPAKSLRRGVDDYLGALKKRRRRGRIQNRQILADTWLEYSFGWKPLVRDANQALEALAFRAAQEAFHNDYVMVKFTARDETIFQSPMIDYQPTGTHLYMSVDRYHEYKHHVRHMGAMRISAKGLSDKSKYWGISLEDFAPTAWELLPWSFLIDYFSNIGDVIAAWSTCTSGLAWSQKTVRQTTTQHLSFSPNLGRMKKEYVEVGKVYDRLTASGTAGYLEYSDKQFSRTPGSLTHPSVQFELPGFGLKWLNMAALLVSRNATRKSPFY